MANERSLVMRDEDGVEQWGCSACKWVYQQRHSEKKTQTPENVKTAFDLHECERNLEAIDKNRHDRGSVF